MAIHFFSEDIKFNLKNKRKIKYWISSAIIENDFLVGDLNIIFCSEKKILSINKKFLKHNFYTDIITFPYITQKEVSSDIFISIQTVKHNSKKFSTTFTNELHRVIIHGILHLLGNSDETDEEKSRMRILENFWLSKLML